MLRFIIILLASSSAIILIKMELPSLITVMRSFFRLKNTSLFEYQSQVIFPVEMLEGEESKKLTSDEVLEKTKNKYQEHLKDIQEQLFLLIQYCLFRSSLISICAYLFFYKP